MNTKMGEVSVKKTQEDHLIDNWPVVEPQNPSVCRVPDLHAVHPEYLVRDISKKNVQIFWSKKLDNNCFYSFDTAACIFPSKACLERCCFQTPLSSPKEPSLELKKNLCFQFIQVGVKRYKICNIENFFLNISTFPDQWQHLVRNPRRSPTQVSRGTTWQIYKYKKALIENKCKGFPRDSLKSIQSCLSHLK